MGLNAVSKSFELCEPLSEKNSQKRTYTNGLKMDKIDSK